MRNNMIHENNLKYICPAVVFIVGLCVYSFRISFSGLWLDEAVEYFYSKIMYGSIEGVNNAANMYERICSTYQPPLYNVLMYVWLRFFDSEFSFRLAGILTTLVGMLGIYTALLKVSGYKWAFAGSMAYIFIPRIAYYALECAEYNLMLCCESWTLYFFVSLLKEKNNKSLAGFFIFSCLSVYSQYGAAFFVAGLYIALLIYFFRDKYMLIKFLGGTLITCIVAVLPLIYFFLIPQMNLQGSIRISHTPLVSWNNIFYDLIRGIIIQAKWDLSVSSTGWGIAGIVQRMMIVFPCVAASVVLFIVIFRYKKLFTLFIYACIISWLLYYSCVITSFYAYTSWGRNTGFGNRYGLFFIPLWLFTLIYASSLFCKTRRHKIISVFLILCFITSGAASVYSGWIKSNAREAFDVWHQKKAFQEKILVYFRCIHEFQFYLQHTDNNNAFYQDNLITVKGKFGETWDYKDLKKRLDDTGVFSNSTMFYIGEINNSLPIFKQVMSDASYIIDTLYENGEIRGDKHVLLYLHSN